MRRALAPLALAAGLGLGGCKTVPEIAGLIGGAAAGGATASPAVGFAVGVGTATATRALTRWYGRSRAHAEQDAIAQVAGALPVGGTAPWHVNQLVPVGDEKGELVVIGELPNKLAACREVALHVDGDPPAAWLTAAICRRSKGWQWASAEPATERWGLQ
ncbi:MAG TPA: hypothetical protein VFA03_08525 [Acetobacteraceae bacterium]|nr:hypothetical protein [Acetobacteraceae bacterium]